MAQTVFIIQPRAKILNNSEVLIMQYLKDNHKFLICLLIALAMIGIGYYEYKQNRDVPMATIQAVTPLEIARALSSLNIPSSYAGEIVNTIERRVQTAPDAVYATKTQEQADMVVKGAAKQDGADAVIKEPKDKITNNYYGIHLDKNNSIGIGATALDGKFYLSAAYERTINKDKNIAAEVIVHSRDLKNIDGGTILIKKRF